MLEKTLEIPYNCKIKPVNPKGNQLWIFNGRTDAEAEAPILWPPDVKSQPHLKRPWCWERLKAGGEGHNRGWDGWMSPTQWTWVWASSGRWWRTGKPGLLQSMGLQGVGHNWATEQQQHYPLITADIGLCGMLGNIFLKLYLIWIFFKRLKRNVTFLHLSVLGKVNNCYLCFWSFHRNFSKQTSPHKVGPALYCEE